MKNKCLGKGTKIKMHDLSLKEIENIHINDKILGSNNGDIIIETIQGFGKLYKISQSNGINYIVNEAFTLCLYFNDTIHNLDKTKKIKNYISHFSYSYISYL